MQQIDLSLWDEFQQQQQAAVKNLEKKVGLIRNSGRKPQGAWTARIVEKIRISELASSHGVERCPKCDYTLLFDDSRGFFICLKAKYSGKKDCDFCGNIVSFTEWLMEAGKW